MNNTSRAKFNREIKLMDAREKLHEAAIHENPGPAKKAKTLAQ